MSWKFIVGARVVACAASLAALLVVCAGVHAGQATTASASGKVVQEPGGVGIRKAVVALISAEGGEAAKEYTTATDASGAFHVEGVAPGKYEVQVTRAGFLQIKKKEPSTVTVEAGQELSGLVYRMQAAGVISGKIVDAEGDPVADAVVEVVRSGHSTTSSDESELGRGQTNDLGEYRIANLKPGSYVLVANAQGNAKPAPNPADKGRQKEDAVYARTYYPGTTDEGQASAVIVTSGGTATANVSLLSSRAYRVSGALSGVSGSQMAQLVLFARGTGQYQATVEDGGRFVFPSVQPGTYEARVLLVTGVGDSMRPAMKMELVRTAIAVTDADLTGLELVAEAGGTVKGKFRVEDDAAMDWTQIEVSLLPAEESRKEPGGAEAFQLSSGAAVNADGTFEIADVPGGTYQVGVSAKSEIYRDYYVKSVQESGREVADTGFAVTGGASLDVVVSAKGSSIEGTVTDVNGRPVVDAEVLAVPASGQRMRPEAYGTAKSGTQGQFTLRGMTPGQYIVVAIEGSHEDEKSAEFLTKYGGAGEVVEVGEGEKKSVALKVVEGKE